MHTLKPPKRVHICFLLQTNLLLTQKHKFTQKHEGRENAASPIPPSTAGSSGMPPKSCLLSLLVPCLGHASRPASPTGQLQCGTGGSRAELSSPARLGPAQLSPARPGSLGSPPAAAPQPRPEAAAPEQRPVHRPHLQRGFQREGKFSRKTLSCSATRRTSTRSHLLKLFTRFPWNFLKILTLSPEPVPYNQEQARLMCQCRDREGRAAEPRSWG